MRFGLNPGEKREQDPSDPKRPRMHRKRLDDTMQLRPVVSESHRASRSQVTAELRRQEIPGGHSTLRRCRPLGAKRRKPRRTRVTSHTLSHRMPPAEWPSPDPADEL